jgi:hypothetical protein
VPACGLMSRPAQILPIRRADTTLQVGGGVICDTPQVERYLSLNMEGKSGGCGRPKCHLEAQNPSACGLGLIAFVLNEAVEKVSDKQRRRMAADPAHRAVHGRIREVRRNLNGKPSGQICRPGTPLAGLLKRKWLVRGTVVGKSR